MLWKNININSYCLSILFPGAKKAYMVFRTNSNYPQPHQNQESACKQVQLPCTERWCGKNLLSSGNNCNAGGSRLGWPQVKSRGLAWGWGHQAHRGLLLSG